MKEGMTRIVGAGQYGLDGRCRWPVLGKEPLVLQVEDGVEVFLTVAEALGMDAVARDKLYAWLADRAAQKVWRQAADTRGEGPKRVEELSRLLREARRRAAWLEYRLARAEREIDGI